MAISAAKAGYGWLKRQFARRGAADADLNTLRGVDREIDEAVAVLACQPDTPLEHAVLRLKALAAKPPPSFDDPDARHFAGDARVVELLKSGARKVWLLQDISSEKAAARTLHVSLFGGDGSAGESLFDDAMSFVALSVDGRLSPSGRLAVDVISTGLGQLAEGQAKVLETVSRLVPPMPVVEAALHDAEVLAEVRRLRRARMLLGDELVGRARTLAQRIDAGLGHATPGAKATAAREIAIVLARAEHADEAEAWVERAVEFGAEDVTPERARIALARGAPDEAMRIIRERDDPVGRSLLLDGLRRRDGDQAALAFFGSHIAGEQLTGPMLQVMTSLYIDAARISEAASLVSAATTEQISDNPALLYLRARLRMASIMPNDVAERFISTDGMMPRDGDLRDDAEGAACLAGAMDDLEEFSRQLPDLGRPDLADLVDMYLACLSLTVGTDTERADARDTLVAKVADPFEAVKLAPLLTLYNLKADWTPLRDHLAQAERLGGWDEAQLRAAFALVMRDNRPAEIAAFTLEHRDRLNKFVFDSGAVSIEIEARIKAGDVAAAKALLEEHSGRLPPPIVATLEAMAAAADGTDVRSMLINQYETSSNTHDLLILIGALEEKTDPRRGAYLVELYRKRGQPRDAARACDNLLADGQEVELEAFLEGLPVQAFEDPHLRVHLTRVRQRQGRLAEAEAGLKALRAAGVDDVNTRRLGVILALELGRWSDLDSFIHGELAKKDERSPRELLQAARIAGVLGSASAMPLVRAAVEAAPDDPSVHLDAYQIAVARGQDRSAEAGGWLRRAIELSGEDGPLKLGNIEDLVAQVGSRREQTDRINDLVMTAQVPLSIAIGPLGGTVSGIMIGRLPQNRDEADSRRRLALPLYSGNRGAPEIGGIRRVALDTMSIFTLEFLGLLEVAIETFEDILLPAGTMHALFEDMAKALPVQPSRIEEARTLKAHVASGVLKVRDEGTPDGILTSRVGDEFAKLFQVAEDTGGFVVDTSPLHAPGNLRDAVDTDEFSHVLISPSGLIDWLLQIGEISVADRNDAAASMSGSGTKWPAEADIEPRRPLVLSTLAAHYLSSADLLVPLSRISSEIFVLRETVELAEREIAAGDEGARHVRTIDKVRETLATALAAGRARVGPMPLRRETDDPEAGPTSPIASAMADHAGVDALICDDRGVNKYGQFTDRSGVSRPILTTLDVIRILEGAAVLEPAQVAQALKRLREGGAALMPLGLEVVTNAALESDWRVGPNADLRSMRDSMHLALARGLVQLPEERTWFKQVSVAIALAVRRIWQEMSDPALATAAATFLLEMIPDPGAWSGGDGSPDRGTWVLDVRRTVVWTIATLFDLPTSSAAHYGRWFDAVVASKAERQDPGAMEAVGRALFAFLNAPPKLEGDDDCTLNLSEDDHRAFLRSSIARLPGSVTKPMLGDPAVLAELNAPVGDFLRLFGHRFPRAAVLAALRDVSNGSAFSLASQDGSLVLTEAVLQDDGACVVLCDGSSTRFSNVALLGDDVRLRLRHWDRLRAPADLPPHREDAWGAAIAVGPLDDALFIALEEDLLSSPEAVLKGIAEALAGGSVKYADLVPQETFYWAELLGVWPPPPTLADFTEAWLARAAELDARRLDRRLRINAPLSVASGAFMGLVPSLAPAQQDELIGALAARTDPLSLIAAFQAACSSPAGSPARARTDPLMARLVDATDTVNSEGAIDLAAALVITTCETNLTGLFAELPAYARRAARWLHASHLAQIFAQGQVRREDLHQAVGQGLGPSAWLADLCDAWQAPLWRIDLVGDRLLHGLAVRRAEQAVQAADDAELTERWSALRDKTIQRDVEDGSSIFFFAPGPLDDMAPDAWLLPELPEESRRAVAEAFGTAGDTDVRMAHLTTISIGADVSGAVRDILVVELPSFLQQLDAERFWDAAETGLRLAARWREIQLADAIMTLVVERLAVAKFGDAGSVSRMIVLAAAASADRSIWLERVERFARDSALAQPRGAGAGDLMRAFDIIARANPDLDQRVAAARSFATMASDPVAGRASQSGAAVGGSAPN